MKKIYEEIGLMWWLRKAAFLGPMAGYVTGLAGHHVTNNW